VNAKNGICNYNGMGVNLPQNSGKVYSLVIL